MSKSCSINDISKWVMSTLASPDSDYTPPSKKFVDNHVMRAIETFYRNTSIQRETITLDLQENVDDYYLEVSSCYEVESLYEVLCEGRVLRPRQDYERREDTLYLSMMPPCDVRNGLQIEVSVIPCLTGCDLPKEVCGEYREAIVAKVLSEFYSMPNMDWANAGLYREMETKYRRLSSDVRRLRRENRMAGPERIQTKRFL